MRTILLRVRLKTLGYPGRMIHAIILTMAADGKAVLDQRSRRWICEACRGHPRTVPEIAEQLRARGWRGQSGALDTTVKKLAQDGYLRRAGVIVQGNRRPSPRYSFIAARSRELDEAIMTNAAHHLDSGDELLLVPIEAMNATAAELRAAGPAVLWGIRTGDSSIGLVVVVSGRVDEAARDRLLGRLQSAGARRVTGGHVMSRHELLTYCERLLGDDIGASQLTRGTT